MVEFTAEQRKVWMYPTRLWNFEGAAHCQACRVTPQSASCDVCSSIRRERVESELPRRCSCFFHHRPSFSFDRRLDVLSSPLLFPPPPPPQLPPSLKTSRLIITTSTSEEVSEIIVRVSPEKCRHRNRQTEHAASIS